MSNLATAVNYATLPIETCLENALADNGSNLSGPNISNSIAQYTNPAVRRYLNKRGSQLIYEIWIKRDFLVTDPDEPRKLPVSFDEFKEHLGDPSRSEETIHFIRKKDGEESSVILDIADTYIVIDVDGDYQSLTSLGIYLGIDAPARRGHLILIRTKNELIERVTDALERMDSDPLIKTLANYYFPRVSPQ